MEERFWLPVWCALLLAVALVASGCRSTDAAVDRTTTLATTTTLNPLQADAAEAAGLRWWNDRVFYEVFVRSFKDSDGDGIGDLGITGIWLMPIFPSPSYHGYDVVDYRSINPDYGTMDDFTAFLAAAHERGIAVIIDLVINHTGVDHPWFQASRSGDPQYADWYLWSESDPATHGPWGQDVWHEADGRHYFGLFWEGMPDLNLANPAVTAEVRDIARYWVEDVGVDGFRLDGARHLIEDGAVMSDTTETVEWLTRFTAYVGAVSPEALVLGEVWSPTLNVAGYVGDALDLAFEFDLASAGGMAVAAGDAAILTSAQERVLGAYPTGQYAAFLSNHDMNRIMSQLQGDVDGAKLASAWLLTNPGVPFLYYGEEVGLQGTKPDERIRTPMPWTGVAPGVGFTSGTPWERADAGFARFNVAAQDNDSISLLSHYRDLIQFRNTSPALRYGSMVDVETGTGSLFASVRPSADDHVLVVGNITANPVSTYALDLAAGSLAGMRGVEAVVGPAAAAPVITETGGFLDYRPIEVIPANGVLVLHFTEEPTPPPLSTTTSTTTTTTTTLPPPDATAADAEVAQAFFDAFSSGDADGWLSLMAPEVVVIDGDEQIGLFDPLPPDLGIPDWNEDGVPAVLDIVLQQSAFAVLTENDVDTVCVPAGPEVACTVNETDMFYRAAGIVAPTVVQRFTVLDERIVEIGGVDVDDPAAADALFQTWVEQFGIFEAWVDSTYPDRFDGLFTTPCCVGAPETLSLIPSTVDELAVLLAEWSSTQR